MKYSLVDLSNIRDGENDNNLSDTIAAYMKGFRKFDGVDVKQCIILSSGVCQLGWDSYCFLTQNCNYFEIYDGECLKSSYGGFGLNFQKTMHIVTRAVSGCTVIVIKYGNNIYFMHLNKNQATRESDFLENLKKFLDTLTPHTDKFFVISSYYHEKSIGKTLTDKVCAEIQNDNRFSGDDFNILNINRCKINEDPDSDNNSCHVEFGIVLNESAEPVAYADFYDYKTGNADGYLEWKFNTTDIEGTILGYKVKNLDEECCSGDGCCIIS